MESTVRPMVNAPRVIETLAWDGQQCVRLARHLARLQRTCAQLGYPLDDGRIPLCVYLHGLRYKFLNFTSTIHPSCAKNAMVNW